MLLYCIRHGETIWNKEGRLQGRKDIPLNENGRMTARITAKALKDVDFDLVISSPLSRARETAEIVLNGRTGIPFIFDDRLMEISWGDWESLGCRENNFEVPVDDFNRFYDDPLHFEAAPGGESVAQVCVRTKDFYRELLVKPEYQDKTILISTHGCAVRAFLQSVYENSEDFWHGHVPYNCAISVVEIKNGNSRLVVDDQIYYNAAMCTNHYK